MSRQRSRAMVAFIFALVAPHLFCLVQPGAPRMTRPSSLQLRRHAFRGAEIVQAFISTGLTFVEQANKLTTFADALQKWSSVVPGNDLRLDIAASTEEKVLDHVKRLCDAIATVVKNNNTISVLGVSEGRHADLGNRVVDYTPFQKLMSKVLAVNRSGCTAVYADPGVGKSIASLRALPAGRASKNYTVLLDGGFRRELQRFFRVTSFDGVGTVAELVFAQLKRAGVSINMVLDNSIEQEPKVEQWQNALRALLKAAYHSGHHIIVIAQSQAIAEKIGGLSGARSRVHPEQEAPPKYRWGEEQAREYLGYLLEARNIPPEDIAVDEFLSNCSIPDTYGGWMPLEMCNYLDLDEKPLARRPSQAGVVWVRQLQQDDDTFKEIGAAFQVKGDLKNVDDLKEAIKKKPNRVSCDADEITIYSKSEDAEWVEEKKVSASLRETDGTDCYGFTLPSA